jgi:arylformamidase
MLEKPVVSRRISRRSMLAVTAAAAATPAAAQECRLGPPPHHQGPRVFLNYDQLELDASYDQAYYEPLIGQVSKRLASASEAVRARLGAPQRMAYGPSEIEKLDIYRTKAANAPVFVMIHGGSWQTGAAKDSGFPAEMFVNAGAHYVALDFIDIKTAGGDLGVMADQVRRGIAWVCKNAASFSADPARIYIGGHSSGGHLCGVALVTDWSQFGLPETAIKGGLCMSGMYEMEPVRLSWRREYVHFTDQMADAMSAQRHIDKLRAPITVTYGTFETPDFQRQSRDFAAAVKAAGKPVELLEVPDYAHLEMAESLGNPYGPNGRAALALMRLGMG